MTNAYSGTLFHALDGISLLKENEAIQHSWKKKGVEAI